MFLLVEGLQSAEVSYLLLTQQLQVQFCVLPKNVLLILLRFIDGAAQKSVQRLDDMISNVNHWLVAS